VQQLYLVCLVRATVSCYVPGCNALSTLINLGSEVVTLYIGYSGWLVKRECASFEREVIIFVDWMAVCFGRGTC
jgi:hypothetical protein